jgi:hypothetical protein
MQKLSQKKPGPESSLNVIQRDSSYVQHIIHVYDLSRFLSMEY